MEFLSEMVLDRGIPPDVVTYSSILHAWFLQFRTTEWSYKIVQRNGFLGMLCQIQWRSLFWLMDSAKKGWFQKLGASSKQWLKKVLSQMFTPTYTALMDGYCLQNQMDEARKVLDIMVGKGCAPASWSMDIARVEGWTRQNHSLLKCLIKIWLLILSLTALLWKVCAVEVEFWMRKSFSRRCMCSSGLLPDLIAYSILLDGLWKHGHLDEALKTLKAMQERKIERDIVLHTILIEGMFIAGKLEVAKELSSKLFVDGMRPTVQTYIKGLLKEGLSDEAYELLRKMEDDGFLPDGCSYNIVIIKGFLQNRDSSTAIRLINEMAGKRFSADSSTFQMLLLLNELSFFFDQVLL